MTYTSARWANDEHVGVLLLLENGPSLYVDGGPLYDQAVAGDFGPIADPIVEPAPPLTEDEVRVQRNQLLAATDWTQVPDAPVDQAAWATYRKALRDVPQQDGFPTNIVWPEQP